MAEEIVPSDSCAVPSASSSGALSMALDGTFSYEGLPDGDALRKQAVRIRDRMETATKALIKAVVETGRDLMAVKQHLEHGKFCEWVEAECGFTIRSAQNYMKAACTFAEPKCETISHLQLSTVYELSAKTTPPELVAQVIKRGMDGQPVSDDEVKEMLAKARFQKFEAKREQKKARRLSKRAREEREAQKRGWEEERRQIERRALAAAQSITERLGPEGLRVIAPAFTGPGAYLVAEHLRVEIENSIGKANPAEEAT